MTSEEWIKKTTQRLKAANIESAHLDATIMLEDTLQHDRAYLFAHPELELSSEHLAELDSKVIRREAHEPLAYIRGHVEFYGRVFSVNKDVLVPRPESESFISLLLKKHSSQKSLLDIGTGSGALGITAKLEIPQLTVTLSDIDQAALKVATLNAHKLGAQVTTKQANLLEAFFKNNIIFANLPYVPTAGEFAVTNHKLLHEPSIALFSGADGLDHYQKFWKSLTELKNRPEQIYTESLEIQHEQLIVMAHIAGYKLDATEGLVQLFTDQRASA